ncbi:MAG: CHASE2 domain-containing protein [Meiothermus sp.]|nr:CHASE2 domain-containing protein [Meiothermus sp.]
MSAPTEPTRPGHVRPFSSAHARKALWRTALVVLVMLASSYILTNNLLGPLGVLVKGPQGASLDRLTRVVHNWGSPVPVRDFPLVVLVELGRDSVQTLSPQGYVFNRGQMARITEKILEYRPKGVFFDFDFSQPTNEGGVLSAGDRRLLEVMRRADAPVLIPDPNLINLPLSQVNPNLQRVSAQVLYDSDGQTRQIPRPRVGQPVTASVGLYCLGLGLPLGDGSSCPSLFGGASSADGKRIVYREIRRFAANTDGAQLWPNLVVIGGLELLQGGLAKTPQTEGALFMVGRTYPEAADVHFTATGPIHGIDIHLNALMTLATYRRFSETLGWGPVLAIVPLVVFFALWLTYSITDVWLGNSRFQGFIKALIETAITAWFLFFAGVLILQYHGTFLDYLYPIVAFQMGSLLLGFFTSVGGKKNGKHPQPQNDRGESAGENLKGVAEETGGNPG